MSRWSHMWGVRYFMGHKWYCMRMFDTFEEAAADFMDLVWKVDIGAVRLYLPGNRADDDYLWHDERLTQEERRAAAVAHARKVA